MPKYVWKDLSALVHSQLRKCCRSCYFAIYFFFPINKALKISNYFTTSYKYFFTKLECNKLLFDSLSKVRE